MFLIKNRYYFSFHQHLYSEILSKYIFPYKDIYSTSNWNNQAMVIFFPPPFFFFLSIEFNWKIYLPTIHVLFNAANVCASLDIVPRSLRSTRYPIFSSITNDPSNIDVFSSLLLLSLFFSKQIARDFDFFQPCLLFDPPLDNKPNRCLIANLHFFHENLKIRSMKTDDVYTRVCKYLHRFNLIEFISLVFEMSASEITSCLNS